MTRREEISTCAIVALLLLIGVGFAVGAQDKPIRRNSRNTSKSPSSGERKSDTLESPLALDLKVIEAERRAYAASTESLSEYKAATDAAHTAISDYARAVAAASSALLEYEKAVAKAASITIPALPEPERTSQEQLLATMAEGDLNVAAILFALFGFSVGQILGIVGNTLRDRAIRTLYRRIAVGSAVGVGISIVASVFAITSSRSRSMILEDLSLLLSFVGIGAVLAVTMYLIAKLTARSWRVEESLEYPEHRP